MNGQVIVAGYIDFVPADRPAALAAFSTVVAQSRREPGCLDYAFTPHPDEPGRVQVFEHWVDDDALVEHLRLPHVLALREQLAPLRRTGRELLHHTVAVSRPMGSASSTPSSTSTPERTP